MEFIGRTRGARRAYSFDEIALAPASTTVDPQDVDLSWSVGAHRFALPFMAAAMDSVVDPAIAIQMSEAGGLAVLNLEGIQTRYDDPTQPLERIAAAAPDEVVGVLQQVSQVPIKDQLVTARIRAIVDTGAVACVSVTPARAPHLLPLAEEGGAQLLALQSTVVTDRHHSSRGRSVSVRDLIEQVGVPVMVGNCVGYDAAMALLEAGAAGLFVGVGPGAACTSRRVLGVGGAQATAGAAAAAARDDNHRPTRRYVPVVAEWRLAGRGGVGKAIARGARAGMLGLGPARAEGTPGKGFYLGVATPH